MNTDRVGTYRTGTDDSAPLALSQEHMWESMRFLNPAHPGATFLTMPAANTIRGELRPAALEAALNAVVSRHEELRITLSETGAGARQRVAEHIRVPLAVDELPEDPDQARARAHLLHAAEDDRPFDLVRGPLLRARLLRHSAREHVLLITFQHLLVDGWGLGSFYQALEAAYGDTVTGRAPSLPPLRASYREVAARQWARADFGRAACEAYWREQLDGAPPPLEIPCDRPRTALSGGEYAVRGFAFGQATADLLTSAAWRWRTSPFTVLTAAFNLLLHRLTGTTDVCVGSVRTTRSDPDAAALVGQFTNTVFLRTRFSPADDFAALVGRVSRTVREAYDHDIPYRRLLDLLGLDRSGGHPRPPGDVCQGWLQVNGGGPAPEAASAALPLDGFDTPPDSLPTRLYPAGDDPRRLASFARENPTFEFDADYATGVMQYNTQIFGKETIDHLADQFRRTLTMALNNPGQPISKLKRS
ncbi:condensation domain-containing protein [Streptomyces sp. NPDC026589]|uniref:condensation domain-containing protein n=1 Tax=Streptomyces sp. NPDC026589 TaxID=3155609 RepID=UPI0033E44FEA